VIEAKRLQASYRLAHGERSEAVGCVPRSDKRLQARQQWFEDPASAFQMLSSPPRSPPESPSCHVDRNRWKPVILSESEGANASEDESKDPEDLSSAMQLQGVLTRYSPRSAFRNLMAPQVRRRSGKSPGQNSLHRHGGGCIVGVSPLFLSRKAPSSSVEMTRRLGLL
jgi:hypothetical protein